MTPEFIGLALFGFGLTLHRLAMKRLWQIVDFGMVEQPATYLTTGVYRLRHPAYIGATLMIAGMGILILGWSGASLVIPALPFYMDRVYREEAIRSAVEGKPHRRERARAA